MDINFFLTDNKSGYKTNEKWLSKNHNEIYVDILRYNENNGLEMNFKEKIWFFFNKLTNRPKCLKCGSDIKFRDRFDKPYGDFCSLLCANNSIEILNERQKKTLNEKYNVDYFPSHKSFTKKQKETKLLRYGDENYNNLEKQKKTKFDKYGKENYVNIVKAKETNLLKYGNEYFSKTDKFKEIINGKYKIIYNDQPIINITDNILTIKCDSCNNIFKTTKHLFSSRLKLSHTLCTKCNPKGFKNKSTYEIIISQFLIDNNIKFETSNNKFLGNNQQLDFLIHDKKLAIEFNGLYWHNELFRDSKYHLNKTNICNSKGYELIHIFEDEWNNKQDIVKSILSNRLNLNKNRIYARNCEIREVDTITTNKFLFENHIQGIVITKYKYGLYFENNLVSLMTLSKGRKFLGGKEDEYELTRFVNKINTTVIGGADRLFKHFIKNINPSKIISYSDIRYFNGNMYEKLGFKKTSVTLPNYWYVLNGEKYHRYNFRKSELVKHGFDKNKTEKEIMFDRKIYRIYDCGNLKWEYNNERK
jgi:very-short-patch-repair endonuclease